MQQTVVERPVMASVTADGASRSGVTWSAVFAGAFTAAAISLILFALGTGFGLVSVSPWPGESASATAFGVGTGIWLIVVQWLASALGGYMSGRLRTKWTGLHTDEVAFRDTAHGFLAWAVATLFVFGLLGAMAMSAASGGAKAATSVLAGSAQGAAQGAAQSPGAVDPTGYFVDLLFRSDTPPSATQPDA